MEQLTKIENWNGHEIRFVDVNGEWYAVLKDVCDACGLKVNGITRRLSEGVVSNHPLSTVGGTQEMLIVNEYGIYDVVFQSRKPEAKEFRYWVYQMLSELRKQTGLEGFEVFRMLDKEHQKEMMARLTKGTGSKEIKTFAKANLITNKAIANKYGREKAISKNDMTPQMLADREEILEATTDLMITQSKYGVPEHVSKVIYDKFAN